MLFEVRKKLTELPKYSNIFINEDLTARRSKLLYDARQVKRAKNLLQHIGLILISPVVKLS